MKGHVMRRILNCVAVFALATVVTTAPAQTIPSIPHIVPGVRTIIYKGWSSYVMEAPDADVHVLVVPSVGGRILRFAFEDTNILFENPETYGMTLEKNPKGFWAGGHQGDVGPEIRGIPQHRDLFQGPYTITAPRDYTVQVESQPDKTTGVQLSRELVLDPVKGDLGVLQTMKNISDKDVAYCLWDRTLCKGGGFAFFPLSKKSRFPAKWSIRRQADGKYFYDGINPQHENVKIIKNVLVARCYGEPSKIGADSDAGWIGYARGNLLFVKYFPYNPKGNYSDGGNSVEVYWSEQVAEIEPLSPEKSLKPGESYSMPQKWILMELDRDITTPEQAAKLVKKIPAFKF